MLTKKYYILIRFLNHILHHIYISINFSTKNELTQIDLYEIHKNLNKPFMNRYSGYMQTNIMIF